MNRQEFYKDKGFLFFLAFIEIVSVYLFFTSIKETYVFIIPAYVSGLLALLELYYISERRYKLKWITKKN
jgi:hypothetical protein